MDALTIAGLIISFAAIFVGQMIEGGNFHSLINFPALLIVLGGTFGAVLVQTSFSTFKQAFKVLPWVFRPPAFSFEESRNKLIELARKARQSGLLVLEEQIEIQHNPILRRGLELLVVGIDKKVLRQILEAEIEQKELNSLSAANFFESMGGYSPTIGILGAVLGLIQVMRNLADPAQLGAGIAVAFVATIYGVGFANLVFLPIANKIKACIAHGLHYDEMLVEGLTSMAAGESPNMLSLKLNHYGQKAKNEQKKKETS